MKPAFHNNVSIRKIKQRITWLYVTITHINLCCAVNAPTLSLLKIIISFLKRGDKKCFMCIFTSTEICAFLLWVHRISWRQIWCAGKYLYQLDSQRTTFREIFTWNLPPTNTHSHWKLCSCYIQLVVLNFLTDISSHM